MIKSFDSYHEIDEETKKSMTNIIWYKTTEECIRGRAKDYKEFSLDELQDLVPGFRVDVYYMNTNNKVTLYRHD